MKKRQEIKKVYHQVKNFKALLEKQEQFFLNILLDDHDHFINLLDSSKLKQLKKDFEFENDFYNHYYNDLLQFLKEEEKEHREEMRARERRILEDRFREEERKKENE